jgi:hypothetical protein
VDINHQLLPFTRGHDLDVGGLSEQGPQSAKALYENSARRLQCRRASNLALRMHGGEHDLRIALGRYQSGCEDNKAKQ